MSRGLWKDEFADVHRPQESGSQGDRDTQLLVLHSDARPEDKIDQVMDGLMGVEALAVDPQAPGNIKKFYEALKTTSAVLIEVQPARDNEMAAVADAHDAQVQRMLCR